MNLFQKIEQLPEKRLRIFAYGCLAMGVTDLFLGTILLCTPAQLLGACLSLVALGGFASVPLLLSGSYNFPRIFVPYFSTALIAVVAEYYTDGVNVYYSCFVGAIYPFAFFSPREKWQIAVTFPVPIFLALLTSAFDFTPAFELLGFDTSSKPVLSGKIVDMLVLWGPFFIVSCSFYIFASVSDRYSRQLEDASRRDRELNQQLNSLVQIICHDIANPLTVADMALADKSAIMTEKKIDKIRTSVQVMKEIVENVRTLQMARNSGMRIATHKVMVEDVLNDCKFLLDDRLKEKNISLQITLDDWVSNNPIMAERQILSQNILANLLTNAIKFSRNGSQIQVSASKRGPDEVVIVVSDKGVGIPKDVMKELFSTNKNKSSRGTANEKGTGFGLAIAKSCIDILGGQIHVISKTAHDSPDDHGTAFEVTLKAS